MSDPIITLDLSPSSFYLAASLIRNSDGMFSADVLEAMTRTAKNVLEEKKNGGLKVLLDELKDTSKTRERVQENADPFDSLRNSVYGDTFLHLALAANEDLTQYLVEIDGCVSKLKAKQDLMLSDKFSGGFDITQLQSYDAIQAMQLEISLNKSVVSAWCFSVLNLALALKNLARTAASIHRKVEHYYHILLERHTKDGHPICEDSAILTDIAIFVLKNVDSHGEINRMDSTASQYTRDKARLMLEVLQNFLKVADSPKEYLKSLADTITDIAACLEDICVGMGPTYDRLCEIFRLRKEDYEEHLEEIRWRANRLASTPLDVIEHRDSEKILTREERFERDYDQETIRTTATMIRGLVGYSGGPDAVIDYILDRKKEKIRYFREENSFYKCRIGQGNNFLGVAPGGLEVVPAERPNATFDAIRGSNFDKVKDFFTSVKTSKKWSSLFLATSPSQSVGKSNVLLIGPQGCGKSEILRAVGADKESISIYASASDFLTCWMGEAQKNPKRLFEAALKLNKESGRHVHLLIDEIDAVLNNDRGLSSTATNLTLEFQTLMDGLISYPNLSVWGATNNPERIPIPMLRRFHSVLIVGELSREDRAALLKQYIEGYLPTSKSIKWSEMAEKIEGATGDVIRKVADHLWRETMQQFIERHEDKASEVVSWLDGGEFKFSIQEFTPSDRAELKTRLRRGGVLVDRKKLEAAIDEVTNNVGVYTEIQQAMQTYANAKTYLERMNSSVK